MNVDEREWIGSRREWPDEAGDILERLLRAAVHIRSRRATFVERYGLTEARYSVLLALENADAEGLSQSELAVKLMQSESNVSTLIERMQREGLVVRSRSVIDLRKRVLFISPDARQLLEQIAHAKRHWSALLLGDVPMHQRLTFASVIRHISENLEMNRATDEKMAPKRERSAVNHEQHRIECHPADEVPLNSPHVALRQMLSTLGLNKQSAKGGR